MHKPVDKSIEGLKEAKVHESEDFLKEDLDPEDLTMDYNLNKSISLKLQALLKEEF